MSFPLYSTCIQISIYRYVKKNHSINLTFPSISILYLWDISYTIYRLLCGIFDNFRNEESINLYTHKCLIPNLTNRFSFLYTKFKKASGLHDFVYEFLNQHEISQKKKQFLIKNNVSGLK